MANFTAQQIEQFLQEFFDVVGARQYIGARYVPIFGRKGEDTIEWDKLAPYEPLTVVMHQGVSYVSKQYVPKDVEITDTDYWAETYRFNAQVEQYRQEVLGFDQRINDNAQAIVDETQAREQAIVDALALVDDDYVPFPNPDTYPKYGTNGQVLTTLANGNTRWEDPVVPSDAQAEAVITTWLNAHPEATTTVQDGAITNSKIANDTIADSKLVQKNGILSTVEGLGYEVGFYGINDAVEQGNIDPNTGGDVPQTLRCRTQYISVSSEIDYTLTVSNSVEMMISEFTARGTARIGTVGWTTQDVVRYTPSADARFVRILFKTPANTTITPSDFSFSMVGSLIGVLDGRFGDVAAEFVATNESIAGVRSLTGYDPVNDAVEQGNIDPNTGGDVSEPLRCRTQYISVDHAIVYTLTVTNDVWMMISEFTAQGTARTGTVGWTTKSVNMYRPSAGTKFVRILFRTPDNTAITPSDFSFSMVGSLMDTLYTPNENSALNTILSVSELNGADYDNYSSGMCMAKGQLYQFCVGPDNQSAYRNVVIYNGNMNDGFKSIKTIYHNFGHVNTVSYNEDTDSIVFGNGSGSYSLVGKVYVYPNFTQAIENGTRYLSIADAIEYEFPSLTGEVQFNAMWGDNNNGQNDLIYLITNDNQKIRLIQLGKGDNQLESGNFVPNDTNDFNGSYKIQKTWTQDVGVIGSGAGESVQYCIQDGEYRNGKIYVGIGHNHFEYWTMTLNSDGSITRESHLTEFYNADGTQNTTGIAAIEVTNQFLIIQATNNKIYTYPL